MPGPSSFDVDLVELRERTSAKWRRYPPDVLPVWVAESDVRLAPPIVEAVTDAVRRGDTGYGFGPELAVAFAGFAARWGWQFDPATTRPVADVMTGVEELVRLLTAPDASVVVTSPVYPPFFQFVRKAGRVPLEVALTDTGRLDVDGLAEAFRQVAGTGAFLLCNPHNPHGTVHTRDELTAVAALSNEFDVPVISDEIHAALVLDGEHVAFPTVPGGERSIALHSASKAWNLAGLKVAIAVPGEQAVDRLAALHPVVGHGASHLGMIAHTAAFRHGGEWLARFVADLRVNRQTLADRLAEQAPAVGYVPGAATYLAWLDFRATGLGADPGEELIRRGRVALRTGADFGQGAAGFARFNFATSAEVIDEAVRRIAAGIADADVAARGPAAP